MPKFITIYGTIYYDKTRTCAMVMTEREGGIWVASGAWKKKGFQPAIQSYKSYIIIEGIVLKIVNIRMC